MGFECTTSDCGCPIVGIGECDEPNTLFSPAVAGETIVPTYEYVCKQCGEQFEVFQSFKARPLKKHDVCGGPVNKVFHASGVVFKGPGFYATDSRSSTSKATPPASGGDTTASSGSPKKPEAKASSTDAD
jgi:putative FmdB family regulatory protein